MKVDGWQWSMVVLDDADEWLMMVVKWWLLIKVTAGSMVNDSAW